MRRPDFFLVGAPRCATTSMFAYLAQHPQLFLPMRKEVHYFGSDLSKVRTSPWLIFDESAYLSLFDTARPDQIVGEVSVMYLYSKRAAQEIKEFNPDAKIIIQLRNPIDMIYSHHSQLLLAVNEDIEDFERALAAEPERREHRRIPPYSTMYDSLFYRDTGLYTEQVKRYIDTFGRDRVHVILYDDLRKNTAEVFAATLDFLGVDRTFKPEFELINPYRRVKNRALQSLTQKPPMLMRALLRLLPDRVGYFGLVRLATWNSYKAKRPAMGTKLRRELAEYFESDVKSLGALLGRDLSHWVA